MSVEQSLERSSAEPHDKPCPNPVLSITGSQTVVMVADKPAAIDSCALGLPDMDSCWIKVLEPDSFTPLSLAGDHIRDINDRLRTKLDPLASNVEHLHSQGETQAASLAALAVDVTTLTQDLQAVSAALASLREVCSRLDAATVAMAAQVYEQHAYLMARRNKKAKTVKYVLS